MGIHFRFNRSNADIPCPNSYCHACAFAYPLDISLMNRYSFNDKWLQNEESLGRASRFRNYKLELDFECVHQQEYRTIQDMMRYAASVFLQKSVQVVVLGPTYDHGHNLRSNIKLLQLLRCERFSIKTNFRIGLGNLLCEVEEVVISDTKVGDLQKIMRNLDLSRSWILEKYKGRRDGEAEHIRKECAECVRAMEEAAKDFSNDKFFEALADFLHLFDKAYKSARQHIFKNDTDVGREPEEHLPGL